MLRTNLNTQETIIGIMKSVKNRIPSPLQIRNLSKVGSISMETFLGYKDLISKLYEGKQRELEDHQKRSRYIVRIISQYRIQKLVLMDGSCSFTILLLHTLFKEKISFPDIEIVEKCETVDKYHS